MEYKKKKGTAWVMSPVGILSEQLAEMGLSLPGGLSASMESIFLNHLQVKQDLSPGSREQEISLAKISK